MSNPVSDVVSAAAAAPKAVFSWAKARPVVFGGVLLLTIILAIRFRSQIAKFFIGLPGVGPFLGKAMNIAAGAAVAFIVLDGGKAWAASDAFAPHAAGHAAGLVLGAAVVAALFAMRLVSGAAPGLLSVGGFPKEDTIDLRTQDGDYSVGVTPGAAEVTKAFKVTASKGSAFGAWIKATGFSLRYDFTFDQAASGGAVVNWDELPRVCSGVEIVHPLWGAILDKETGSGPILKHIIEFIGNGYQYAGDGPRAQIAAADADTTCSLYLTYPIAQRCMVRPQDQACWVGWLDQTLINVSIAAASAIAAVSTGAVIKGSTTVQCGLDYFLDNDLEVPTIGYWKRYSHNAGTDTIRLLSMGSTGPKATKKVERVIGLYELHSPAGLGGCTTADNILRVLFEQRGLDRVTNVDMLTKSYLRTIGPRALSGGVGSAPAHPLAGNPYLMSATPNGKLNDAGLMYTALIAPGREQEIVKAWKFAGDLTITQEYTTTPTSGAHRVVAQTIREFEPEMVRELKARAGKGDKSHDVPLANGDVSRDVIPADGVRKYALGFPRSVSR